MPPGPGEIPPPGRVPAQSQDRRASITATPIKPIPRLHSDQSCVRAGGILSAERSTAPSFRSPGKALMGLRIGSNARQNRRTKRDFDLLGPARCYISPTCHSLRKGHHLQHSGNFSEPHRSKQTIRYSDNVSPEALQSTHVAGRMWRYDIWIAARVGRPDSFIEYLGRVWATQRTVRLATASGSIQPCG